MSEKAKWVESLWGFTNLNFKLNLKVSAFYLEKQKSFIPKKKYFLGRTAKVHPKDGVSRLNFPEGFAFTIQLSWIYCPYSQVTFSWIVKKRGGMSTTQWCVLSFIVWLITMESYKILLTGKPLFSLQGWVCSVVQNLRNKNKMIRW